MVVYYTHSLERLFSILVICSEYVKPFWILFGPLFYLVEALHHCFDCLRLTVAMNCMSVISAPWNQGGVSKIGLYSAHMCLSERPLWSIIHLTKSLKRNNYSLSHNIKKLTRRERISCGIATIMALQPNEWYRSTMYISLCCVSRSYICGATPNTSIAETQQNTMFGIATQLGKSNE